MKTKAKAVLLYEPKGKFVIEEVEYDEPREDEVLVKVEACGICHTDARQRQYCTTVKLPAILGHEGAGVVEKTGSGVTDFQPGDHVVMTIPHCGECEACRRGEYISCKNTMKMYFGREDGTPRVTNKDGLPCGHQMGQGSFGEYVLCHKSSCVKIEEDIPFYLAGPVGCGFTTGSGTVLNYLKPKAEDSVAVFGCGGTGMPSVMGAKLAGCKTIIAVDVQAEKLELAKELGATHTINVSDLEKEKGHSVPLSGPASVYWPVSYPLADEIKRLTDGKGVDYAIVTAPLQEVISPAIFSLAKFGECCITASLSVTEVPTIFMQANNLKISSCGMGCANKYEFFPYLLGEYKKGNYQMDKLIKRYKFTEVEQAFEDLESGDVIKAVLEW